MNRKRKSDPQNRYIRPLIVGTVTAVIVTAAVILISALFFVIRDMPKTAAMPIALVASGLGSFVGAVACVVFTVMGVLRAYKGTAKDLPLVGKYTIVYYD